MTSKKKKKRVEFARIFPKFCPHLPAFCPKFSRMLTSAIFILPPVSYAYGFREQFLLRTALVYKLHALLLAQEFFK